MMMQARCKCGNGVFIVMVQPYSETDKRVDVEYECTLCPFHVTFTIPIDEARAFCDGLNGKFGDEDDEEA